MMPHPMGNQTQPRKYYYHNSHLGFIAFQSAKEVNIHCTDKLVEKEKKEIFQQNDC